MVFLSDDCSHIHKINIVIFLNNFPPLKILVSFLQLVTPQMMLVTFPRIGMLMIFQINCSLFKNYLLNPWKIISPSQNLLRMRLLNRAGEPIDEIELIDCIIIIYSL